MEKRLRALLPGGEFKEIPQLRSQTMRAVRGKGNRTTEQKLRLALVRSKVKGWVMHPDLVGRPDFFFPNAGLAVFVDGCFWHGCPKCGHVPQTRKRFWEGKIRRNRERDREVEASLRKDSYRVLRFWEHDLANDLSACVLKISKHLPLEI